MKDYVTLPLLVYVEDSGNDELEYLKSIGIKMDEKEDSPEQELIEVSAAFKDYDIIIESIIDKNRCILVFDGSDYLVGLSMKDTLKKFENLKVKK